MPVLFDLNGTLLDAGAMTASWPGSPRGAALRALDAAVAQAMVDTLTGAFRPFGEYVAAGLAREAAAVGPLPPELVEQALAAARALPPFPDAAPALAALREAGIRPSVLTNSGADAANEALDAAGLAGLVDAVIGADMVGAYKPDPRVYEAGLRAVGASAEDTWLVAAHWWDVAGAKRAGLRSAWVGRDEPILLATVPEPDVQAPDLAVAVARIAEASP